MKKKTIILIIFLLFFVSSLTLAEDIVIDPIVIDPVDQDLDLSIYLAGDNETGYGSTARVYLLSGQSIWSGSWTKITFSGENWDNRGEYDTTAFRFTPTTPGYYFVYLQAGFSEIIEARVNAAIKKNGSWHAVSANYLEIVSNQQAVVSDIVYLNGSTDYIDFWTYQGSGSAKSLLSNFAYCYASIHKLFSMPDIYSQIINTSTDAEFYIDKSISYGDLILIILLSVILLYIIFKGVAYFVFNIFGHLK